MINIVNMNSSVTTLSSRPLTSVAVTMTLLTDLWSIYVVSWIFPPQEQEKLTSLSLGREDPLERKMTTHSSILVWEVPWAEEPDRLQSMVHKELDTT